MNVCRAYRNSPTLFRMVPSPTPYGLRFLKIGAGFATQLPPLISGTGKATGFKFGGYIYCANPNKTPLKFLEKMERGVSRDCPNFFGVTLLSQERIKLRTSNLAGTFTGPIEVKACSRFRRKWSVGVSRDCQIFWVPPNISGKGTATDFKFGRYISRAYQNKSLLKFFEKRERGRIQGLPKFFGYPYYLRNG